MFHGSKFEPRWQTFLVGSSNDDRWIPVCQSVLRSEGDLASFSNLHAVYLMEKTEPLGKGYFETGDMVGFYTDTMLSCVEIDDIRDRYDAKTGCLSLTAELKVMEGVTDRDRYYNSQQLVLVKFDRPLPETVRVLMDYSKLPLDDESRKSGITEIPPLAKPSRLNMISIHPSLQKIIGKSQPKP